MRSTFFTSSLMYFLAVLYTHTGRVAENRHVWGLASLFSGNQKEELERYRVPSRSRNPGNAVTSLEDTCFFQ